MTVTYDSTHLPPWTIEELAEDTLSPVERALALDHVRDCSRCAADLDVSRAVIAALSALPAFAPSPGFADTVMARVAVPAFAESAEQARVRRWLPRSQKGWMYFLGGVLAPIAPLMALLTWLLGYPGVSAASLWGVAR
ncbi:MAG TPA: hypothetical protein VEW03_12630, partial [Longimicrobiaceae bacterium]|nr:hypothetical protein [Longimicrobiaceae bacterium]